jgi:hypothetical protein
MINNSGIYDPLPGEAQDATLQCAGCKGRISAGTYPPGVPCPQCRSVRRRMDDGTILPKRSMLPWIILIDILVTALLAAGIIYYFSNRPATEPVTDNSPLSEVSPVEPLHVANAEPTPAREEPIALVEKPAITFLDALPDPSIEIDIEIADSDGDGIPTIRGEGSAPPISEEVIGPTALPPPSEPGDIPPVIPTITGEDLEILDEDYAPIEFVGPPSAGPSPSPAIDSDIPPSAWSLEAVVDADMHDAFDDRGLKSSHWTSAFHETPDPCQAYFMLSREQLLVGATEARPQGPQTLTWTTELSGDFEASIDFRWVLPPREGQCGLYMECVDSEGEPVVFVDLVAWGPGDDARKMIFRCAGGAGAVHSLEIPAFGRIRITRQGSVFASEVWDQTWKTVGKATLDTGALKFRLSGYTSSDCPRFALALDDFQFTHRDRSIQRLAEQVAAVDLAASEVGPPLASADRPGVVSIREAPDASGAPARPYSSLPYAMAALPTGSIAADLHNGSDTDMMVGLRSEHEGLDVRVPARATKRAMIPAGAYTVVLRNVETPGQLLESAPIHVPPGTSALSLTMKK